MKKALAIILLLGATCSRSEETFEPHRLPPVVAQSVVRELKQIQNSDGSWGDRGTKQLATAFALISFMRECENQSSREYGRTVQAAHAWLLDSEPKTDAERVATAIALSDYITLHYRWHHHSGENRGSVPNLEMQKLKHCIQAISPHCGEMWADLLRASRMPEELGFDLKKSAAFALWEKYAEREPAASPSTVNDYLLLTLCSQASFHLGGQQWSDFHNRFMPSLLRQYQNDGLFACTPTADQLPATGLAVMACTVYYQTSHRFSPRLRQPDRAEQDEEIVIEIK